MQLVVYMKKLPGFDPLANNAERSKMKMFKE
jgi:hypothetical protein